MPVASGQERREQREAAQADQEVEPAAAGRVFIARVSETRESTRHAGCSASLRARSRAARSPRAGPSACSARCARRRSRRAPRGRTPSPSRPTPSGRSRACPSTSRPPGARTRHSSSIIDGTIGTCSMTCEHSTHGKLSSANGSAKPDARTRGAGNRRANRSLLTSTSSATLPSGRAPMMWLDPQPTSSTGALARDQLGDVSIAGCAASIAAAESGCRGRGSRSRRRRSSCAASTASRTCAGRRAPAPHAPWTATVGTRP